MRGRIVRFDSGSDHRGLFRLVRGDCGRRLMVARARAEKRTDRR